MKRYQTKPVDVEIYDVKNKEDLEYLRNKFPTRFRSEHYFLEVYTGVLGWYSLEGKRNGEKYLKDYFIVYKENKLFVIIGSELNKYQEI